MPLLPEVHLPRLTGQMLYDVVHRKSATAGSLDGWGWKELKVLPVAWCDGLARILTMVEDNGIWPDGLLDAYITMIPKSDGDATPLGQRPLPVLPVVCRVWASTRMVQLEGWFSLRYLILFSVLGVVVGRLKLGILLLLILKMFFLVLLILMFIFLLQMLLRALILLIGVFLIGLGESWTRDGGIPQGCPLSMMFMVAVYLLWCRYLAAQEGVEPQLYADNLKCVSRDPGLLLHAARFTTGHVRLVGQEPAPSKCVLLSTSRQVRQGMKDWVLSLEGEMVCQVCCQGSWGTSGCYLSGLVCYPGCQG